LQFIRFGSHWNPASLGDAPNLLVISSTINL
jgi:hypothetical protein